MTKDSFLKIILPILLTVLAIFAVLIYKNLIFSGSRTTVTHFTSPSADSLQDYFQKSQELAQKNSQTASTTFLAVGDIMLSRNVAAVIQKSGDSNFPFLNFTDILASTDFNFGNLESPFTDKQPIIGGHSLIFGAPIENAKGLADYNFKVLNLANNHSFDQGLTGINVTKKTLDQLNILHEGVGDNLNEAWQPAITTSNGIKICFIGASYSSINDGGQAFNDYVARTQNLERLKSEILKLKSNCNFIIATMHAGTEYTRTPNSAQTTFAHAAINYGADMVIGAHPHWIQTIEKYCPATPSSPGEEKMSDALPLDKIGQSDGQMRSNCENPKYIFYSLGNFIFDQAWSQDTKEGLALKIQISKVQTQNPVAPKAATADDLQGTRQPAKLDFVELIPVVIENSQPRPATDAETKKILLKINLNTKILAP